MLDFFLMMIALNWLIRDTNPEILKKVFKYGVIIFFIVLVISSGSFVCLTSLAVLAGIVGLNYFCNHSTY